MTQATIDTPIILALYRDPAVLGAVEHPGFAGAPPTVARVLTDVLWVNLGWAVLNLLPLPPLDGGRIAVGILPLSLAVPLAKMERYGLILLIGVVIRAEIQLQMVAG